MSIQILLADPDEHWLMETSQILKGQYYDVYTAQNGKDAQLLLYNQKFFAIVLNLSLEEHSGGNVFKYVKHNFPSIKVILTISNENELEGSGLQRGTLERQNSAEIFTRPIEMEKMVEALRGYQDYSSLAFKEPVREGQLPEVEVEAGDEGFTSTPIDEFLSSKCVQYDVYVKISEKKYLKILHSGDTFTLERINKYKNDKKMAILYFLQKDRKKFLSFGNFLAEKLADKSNISTHAKLKILKNVGEKFAEELLSEGIRPQVLAQGKSFCHNMHELVNKSTDLGKLLIDFQDFGSTSYSHSYLVCLFVGMISKQYSWEQDTSADVLGMSALFHDIGHLKLPPELVDKKILDMTPEELKVYKTHPSLGAELLDKNSKISEVVKQIVLQHHECVDGSGFPMGLRSNKILIFSKIISMCDDFVMNLVEHKLTPAQTYKNFLSDSSKPKKYGASLLENLLYVFTQK